MGFTLEQRNTGEIDTFSTQDLLNILGDPVNDEIVLNGLTYKLSSFTAGAIEDYTPPQMIFRTLEFLIGPENNNIFNTRAFAGSTDALLVMVNGVCYRYGVSKDFHFVSGDLHWHGPMDLETNDILIVKWLDYDI